MRGERAYVHRTVEGPREGAPIAAIFAEKWPLFALAGPLQKRLASLPIPMEAVMSTRRSFLSIASIASLSSLAFLAAACSSKSSDSGSIDAQDQADSVEATSSNAQSTHFTELFTSSVTSSDPQQAATSNAAIRQFWPASCATRAQDPTNPLVVHVTLNDCTGPFGMVHVSGELTATFGKNASGGLTVNVTSSNLTANGHAVSESGTGDVTISGATRTVAWQGAWTRVNAAGETVSHTTTANVVIDTAAQCRTTNGSAQTNVAAREIDSTITDYKICKLADGSEGCPSGEIVHTSKRTGKSLTIDFDGTADAKVTGPAGHSAEVPLVCSAS